MKRKLKAIHGFYVPSFLQMYVASDKNLSNIDEINDNVVEAIYLHEYIHFIQDVTTNYGLANIARLCDYLRFANNHIRSLPKGEFKVPVYEINDKFNVDSNVILFGYYLGSGEDNSCRIKEIKKETKTVELQIGYRNLDCIRVEYLDESDKAQVFDFGALCIMESMAYLIESSCYPNYEPTPALPYLSATKLVEFEFPEFGSNPLNNLALCEASLNFFNSGVFFL